MRIQISILLCLVGAALASRAADSTPTGRRDSTKAAATPEDTKAVTSKAVPGASAQGSYLTLFVEPYQGAFYMLIPKSWKAEGGMCGSGVPWNKVDILEGNIRLRITSPDGKSFFGWYPKFFLYDPKRVALASGGLLNPQAGTEYNGMWLYPYMTIPQYVQTLVFGVFSAKEFENPKLTGPVHPMPELKKLIQGNMMDIQSGYVDFACSVMSSPRRGRLYALLSSMDGSLWSNSATFGWLAPQERWEQDGRLMECCIRTFKFNPAWVKANMAGAARRGEAMAALERKLAEDDLRAQRDRLAHSSDSQNEFYKVLTGQMETRDAKTGEEKWMPSYSRAYTDGNGNYYLSDYQGSLPVESDPGWRKLEIINRNETR